MTDDIERAAREAAEARAEAKERPILFSGPMVRAILAGRKTQTRRVVKPQPANGCRYEMNGNGDKALHLSGPSEALLFVPVHARTADHRLPCPYGEPGNRLWVKEGFSINHDPRLAVYRADATRDDSGEREGWWVRPPQGGAEYFVPGDIKWTSSRFMPRIASRLTLEVTGVRVERLQEISERDVCAEGIDFENDPNFNEGERLHSAGATLTGERYCFMRLWNSINAKRGFGWEANPWCWVVEFRRVKT